MANPLICVFNPVTSFIDEVQSISTGPAAIGVPIVTNLLGVIDTSLLGIGSTATAGQTISSGTLVNLYSFAGTLHAQIASAQNGGGSPPAGPYPLPAQGFAASSASINQAFTVSFFGTFKYVDGNSEFNAGSIGQEVYLSDRGDGSVTLTPPSGPGELEQAVGYVVSFTTPNVVVINFASGFQDFTHISGVNPISKGGTGATTGAQALINLIGGSPSTGQALIWNGSAWAPGTDVTTFAQITTGTNTTATMTVSTGASLTFSGSGVINANQLTGDPVNTAGRTTGQALVWNGSSWAPSSGPITAFNDITSGTNTTATMTVGTGASIVVSGTGVVEATELATTGAAVVVSTAAPPSLGQVLTATSATAANWQTPPGSPSAPSTSVQFNNAGAFAGDAAFEWNNTDKTLTLGTGSPELFSSSLQIANDFSTDTTNQWGGILNDLNLTAPLSQPYYGERVHIAGTGTGDFSDYITGAWFALEITNTGQSAGVAGITTTALDATSGISAGVMGATFSGEYGGTGTIARMVGAELQVSQAGGAGHVTKSAVLNVKAPGFSTFGDIQHHYGIFIEDQTPGTTHNPDPWAIFVEGGVSGFRGVATHIVTKTTTYAATADDHTINCNGTFTLTLPTTGLKDGQEFYVKNIGTGSITVTSAGNIDGAANYFLTVQYQSAIFQWDGTTWWVY